jgi:hypothetical protein
VIEFETHRLNRTLDEAMAMPVWGKPGCRYLSRSGEVEFRLYKISGPKVRLIHSNGAVKDFIDGDPNTITWTIEPQCEEYDTREQVRARIQAAGLTMREEQDPEYQIPDDFDPPDVIDIPIPRNIDMDNR